MPELHRITSLDHSMLQPYRTLRRPTDHIQQGIFVAEGEKVVRRLLATDIEVVSLLVTDEWYDKLVPSLQRGIHRNVRVFIGGKNLMENIVGYDLHQGVMAVARVPSAPSLESLLEHAARPYFLVALDGLTNAENVGVVVRNCAAFGVQAILVGETSASPYLRRAVRNSMGTVFRLHVIHVPALEQAIQDLRNREVRILIADPRGERHVFSADFAFDTCVVFGSEESGVAPTLLPLADERVAIPMRPEIDSLNVASASAVVLAEAARQRSHSF